MSLRVDGALIAARRLADDPRAAFRAVSGLVLALFITTVAVLAIATQNAKDLTRFGSAAEANVLTDQVWASNQGVGNSVPGAPGARAGEAGPGPAAPVAPLTAQLRRIPGVHGVLVVRAAPRLTIPGTLHGLGGDFGSTGPVPAGVVSCAQLATVPALGRCPAGATAAAPRTAAGGRVIRRLSAGAATPAATRAQAVALIALDSRNAR